MSTIERVIEQRKRDLGGFTVGRVLPFAKRRMVGPFIFFDEMGPATFEPETGVDVRPHPHIGLATVTYLFEGEIRHRDSLGYDRIIQPGDVNWMTAGSGIVHSERTDAARRRRGQKLHGIQSWIALPEKDETIDPSFHHHPKATLPLIERDRLQMRLIAGNAFGETSPVKTYSDMFYLGVEARAGATIPLPDSYEDRAIYVVEGGVLIEDDEYGAGKMIVFAAGSSPQITATKSSKLMLLGGAPLGERIIWWNLVATSQDKIDQAKADWKASAEAKFEGSVFTLPPGETEFIPAPEN